MQSLQAYFEYQPDSHRIAVLTLSIIIFWNVENIASLNFNYKKWNHAITNSLFSLTDAPIQFILGIALTYTSTWVTSHEWGLIHELPLRSSMSQFVVVFILLDLLEYIYHILMHKVKILWMFHLVHHSDRVVDTSTVLREHPFETAIRLSFLIFWVLITGAGFWMILARQFIQVISNVFAHANFRLPERVDKIVSWVFITPNAHHVHHHFQLPYTDSNYGDVLSVWDRLFGTFRRMDAAKVVFGVDTHLESKENAVFQKLLTMPFSAHSSSHTIPEQSIVRNDDELLVI
ncbi:sterol desaturase family protein [Runella sp. MFBS21]|uniref:sterol desaturase family protein n=1 Tax=Runella sp. MFBS21 TaxID=3034018 RepID=UPI0023F9E3E1|nr:sterol desaturase family protein [Runella sp. MFBS21]MCA0233125.1 sterol desaturase family protein [Bacteroidota bacterium]MDF7821249.1 sterol desaturase family protein [Runella sp. MFBS21]